MSRSLSFGFHWCCDRAGKFPGAQNKVGGEVGIIVGPDSRAGADPCNLPAGIGSEMAQVRFMLSHDGPDRPLLPRPLLFRRWINVVTDPADHARIGRLLTHHWLQVQV